MTIRARWEASDGEAPNVDGGKLEDAGHETTVTMRFTALDDGRTLVEIAEEGWRQNQGALDASYGNCLGWTGMLLAAQSLAGARRQLASWPVQIMIGPARPIPLNA